MLSREQETQECRLMFKGVGWWNSAYSREKCVMTSHCSGLQCWLNWWTLHWDFIHFQALQFNYATCINLNHWVMAHIQLKQRVLEMKNEFLTQDKYSPQLFYFTGWLSTQSYRNSQHSVQCNWTLFYHTDVLKRWSIPDVSKGQSGSLYVIFCCGQVRIGLKCDFAPVTVCTNKIHKWHQFVSIIMQAAGNIHNNLKTIYNITQSQ
jgi:hypothetical protein